MYTASTYRLANIHNLEQKLVWVLGAAVLLLGLSYLYLINDSIFHVAARKDAEEKIAVVETEITTLVSDYMAISATIDKKRAELLGFQDAGSAMHFVATKADTALTLSFGR